MGRATKYLRWRGVLQLIGAHKVFLEGEKAIFEGSPWQEQ